MAGKVITYSTTLITASGTVSSNLSAFKPIRHGGGYIEQIYLKSVSSSTKFDFYIISPGGNAIYRKKNLTQLLNDTSISLPVHGIYTFTITNASANEAFSFEMGFKEERI